MPEQLGIRAYARHRGVSHVAVLKAIQAGRLGAAVQGAGRRTKIDVAAADREWDSMTDGRKVREPEVRRGGAPPRQGALPGMDDGGEGEPAAPPSGLTVARASAMKLAVDVKLRNLEYQERLGNLVNRHQVEREAFELARRVRDAVMAVPERLGDLPPEPRAEMERELRAALSSLGAE